MDFKSGSYICSTLGKDPKKIAIITMPSFLLFAVLVIPTDKIDGWKTERFSSIPSNEVMISSKGLLVRVHSSASPLIFPLKSYEMVTSFKVSGEFLGLPKFSDVTKQGQKGSDDYVLKVGLIVPGKKTLRGFKKFFAPQWVKHLYDQVPEGMGLDHVHFFNISQNPSQVGKTRKHPASDLIEEEFIALVSAPGPFTYTFKLSQPLETAALWLGIDGDDTKSDFAVAISKLELVVESK